MVLMRLKIVLRVSSTKSFSASVDLTITDIEFDDRDDLEDLEEGDDFEFTCEFRNAGNVDATSSYIVRAEVEYSADDDFTPVMYQLIPQVMDRSSSDSVW